jgi:nicotinamide-nucleotide amidase
VTDPAAVVAALRERGLTVACCESLTGGLVLAALVSPAGASAVVRGGLVAYATDLKTALAGVPADLIAAEGVVSEAVAYAMARGVREVCRADVGLATTGVAGPGALDGIPAGAVWLAVVGPGWAVSERLTLDGDRTGVRSAATTRALALLDRAVVASVAG